MSSNLTTFRTVVNTKETAEQVRLQFNPSTGFTPVLRIRPQDSIVLRNFRTLQRRESKRVSDDSDMLLTEYVKWDVFPENLTWGADQEIDHITPFKTVASSAVVKYTLTGPAFSAGSTFSAATPEGKFSIPAPSASAVAAGSIADYTLDIFVTVDDIDVYLIEDATVELNYIEPLQSSLEMDANSAETLAVTNATSAVHLVTIEPAEGDLAPDDPMSTITDSAVTAASTAAGSITIAVPNLEGDSLGNYLLTIKLSAATPVTIMESQPIEIVAAAD